MKHTFIRDVLYTIWERQTFEIEADTREQALEIAKKQDTGDAETSEFLYETQQPMSLVDNDNQATIEIFIDDSSHVPLWTNAPERKPEEPPAGSEDAYRGDLFERNSDKAHNRY